LMIEDNHTVMHHEPWAGTLRWLFWRIEFVQNAWPILTLWTPSSIIYMEGGHIVGP